MDLLPSFVRLRDNELLSSWLFRLASSHDLDLHEFCELLWPEIALSDYDVDNMSTIVSALSELTDTNLQLAKAALFTSQEVKWLMPVNKIHRNRKSYGLMICPRCVGMGEFPYFRKRWRLSLSFVCEQCGIRLIDRCPNCFIPINVFTCILMGIDRDLACNCGLVYAGLRCLPVKDVAMDLQLKVNHLLFDIHHTSKMSHYVEGVSSFTSVFTSRDWNAMDFTKAVAHEILLDIPKLSDRYGFNNIDVIKREMILRMADWVMVDWPLRYFYVCKAYKLPQHVIANRFPEIGRLIHL